MSSPPAPSASLLESLFGERRRPHPAVAALGAIAVIAGIVLRFYTPSSLWLDETLSVNIARLPVTQIPAALAHDGSPPLYYVLLHFWMDAFGRGDIAVRALSGVISVATLPVFWLAGRRLGGRTVAWVTFFLALSSPFAINYATTTRMYSLMILLSLLGFVALSAAYESPTRPRLFALGAVTAAILYTHYWGIYLVISAGLWLIWRMRTERRGWSAFKAMFYGGVLWLPWAPVFIYQTLHTGTPWTTPAGPGDLLSVFSDWSGDGPWGGLLMFATFLLFIFGTFGRTAVPGTRVAVADANGHVTHTDSGPAVVIELKPRPGMAPMVGVAVATLVVAVVLGRLANAAFVARYTAVVLPLFLLVMGTGVAVMPGRRFRSGCVAVIVVAGLLAGSSENGQERTQAVKVAAVLNTFAKPGDVVVFCPDQLGPAVDRLLTVKGLTELTFPRAIGPGRVDWVDYLKTINSTNVWQYAQQIEAQVPATADLWLVWRDGYPGFGTDCGDLQSWFNILRPSTGNTVTLVRANGNTYYEYENLTRFTG